jgi:hypothetical protein
MDLGSEPVFPGPQAWKCKYAQKRDLVQRNDGAANGAAHRLVGGA